MRTRGQGSHSGGGGAWVECGKKLPQQPQQQRRSGVSGAVAGEGQSRLWAAGIAWQRLVTCTHTRAHTHAQLTKGVRQ